MINKHFEDYLAQKATDFLIPAENLAVLIDTHNMDHAKLLLSHMTYSRVPVVTKEGLFVGTIGLTEITKYQLENDIRSTELNQDIRKLVKTDLFCLEEDYQLEQVMRELIEVSFLPVVDKSGRFKGIITRKVVLKAINSLLHGFGDRYLIGEKNDRN